MVSVEHLALFPVKFTVNPLLSPSAYVFQAHLVGGGGGGGNRGGGAWWGVGGGGGGGGGGSLIGTWGLLRDMRDGVSGQEVSLGNLYEDLGAARAYALICLFQDAYMH